MFQIAQSLEGKRVALRVAILAEGLATTIGEGHLTCDSRKTRTCPAFRSKVNMLGRYLPDILKTLCV